jgi:hypothetical protein
MMFPPQRGTMRRATSPKRFGFTIRTNTNVSCTFVDGKLRLVAENDYDPEGLNLMDEFSDNICAYVEAFDGDLKLVSVETLRWLCPRRLVDSSSVACPTNAIVRAASDFKGQFGCASRIRLQLPRGN